MIKETDVVYIAGPMTGIKNFNREAFNQASDYIHIETGCIVLNPAVLPLGLKHDQYMEICLPMVNISDVIVLLPGWEGSKGANAELDYAIGTGKRTYEYSDVCEWIKSTQKKESQCSECNSNVGDYVCKNCIDKNHASKVLSNLFEGITKNAVSPDVSSEIVELEALLADIPEENVIDRWGLEQRLESKKSELANDEQYTKTVVDDESENTIHKEGKHEAL